MKVGDTVVMSAYLHAYAGGMLMEPPARGVVEAVGTFPSITVAAVRWPNSIRVELHDTRSLVKVHA